MGWLGASPDAFVTDPSVLMPHGIAEFKCPFSKKDIPPLEACNAQCLMTKCMIICTPQLQLFVTMDMCDFSVYTLKGIAVEKIRR